MPIEIDQKQLRKAYVVSTIWFMLYIAVIAFPVGAITGKLITNTIDIIALVMHITAIVFWAFFMKISLRRYKRILWAFDSYYYQNDKLQLWKWRIPIENVR